MSERVQKSLLNAEINLLFYFLSLFFAFFSRKIFLDNLGTEFIGLTGTLNNILGYLNLTELGISASIGYFLFKPLQSGNRQEICEILSLLGYLYKWIGGIIFLGAFIVSLFFPLMFEKAELSLYIIYFAFYSFLGSSLTGYFINYRQILLSADQKNYLVAVYYQSANLFKLGLQIYMAYYYKNLYVWVAVEFLFAVIGCVILNWKINKEYPWLVVDKKQGKKYLKNYPEIITKTKQVFIHKIKDFVLIRSDELFVFIFVSLKMVAFYGNYLLIIAKIDLLFNSALDSVRASVGNLVAEGNKQNTMKVFWELMAIRHFLAGFLCFSLYLFIEPFISLWLGRDYILSHNILILLVIYIYISNTRKAVDIYNHAYGLYADTWSAWVELFVNIGITIYFGIRYGIIGILMGKIISIGIIAVFWKPYYLFNKGFHLPYFIYWIGTVRYHVVIVIAFVGGILISRQLQTDPYSGYISWIIFCAICSTCFLLLEAAGFYLFTYGAKDLLNRIKRK